MNSATTFLFSTLVIFLSTTTISTCNGSNETDYQALLGFKSMITHDPHEALSSWNASVHYCDWSGVSCGKRHRRVTALELDSQGLEGSLSPHVGNLSFLRVFILWKNSFQGTIPHQLGRLSKLQILDLGFNKFNGVIPTNLSGCVNIIKLGLHANNLVGSIPKQISFLSKLTVIAIHKNNFTGGIPPALGNLTSMEKFSAAYNPFGGSIPETLGNWKSLKLFGLGGCNLNGTIPHSIYNLSLLTFFTLDVNQHTGSLPSALGAMLPHLEVLQIQLNQLTGPLPPSISNCSKLRHLEVEGNHFHGKLTIDFSRLKDINIIAINDNIFGSREADDMKFIDTLNNCTRLVFLDLYHCNFQQVLPASIGNLSNQLDVLTTRKQPNSNGRVLQKTFPLPNCYGLCYGMTFRGKFTTKFAMK